MKTQEARDLGKRIAAHVHADEIEAGYALLAPVLAERTPFRLLGLIGEAVGAGPLESTNAFLDRIASEKTEGGWVVIGKMKSHPGQCPPTITVGGISRWRHCSTAWPDHGKKQARFVTRVPHSACVQLAGCGV